MFYHFNRLYFSLYFTSSLSILVSINCVCIYIYILFIYLYIYIYCKKGEHKKIINILTVQSLKCSANSLQVLFCGCFTSDLCLRILCLKSIVFPDKSNHNYYILGYIKHLYYRNQKIYYSSK